MENMVISEETKKHLQLFSIMYKTILESNLSEHTKRMILDILEEKSAQGKEQRFQAISEITDILRTHTREEEIEALLRKL